MLLLVDGNDHSRTCNFAPSNLSCNHGKKTSSILLNQPEHQVTHRGYLISQPINLISLLDSPPTIFREGAIRQQMPTIFLWIVTQNAYLVLHNLLTKKVNIMRQDVPTNSPQTILYFWGHIKITHPPLLAHDQKQ